MESQINLSHRLWTRKSAEVEECRTAVKRLCLTGVSDCPLSPSGQCAHRATTVWFLGSGWIVPYPDITQFSGLLPFSGRSRRNAAEPGLAAAWSISRPAASGG